MEGQARKKGVLSRDEAAAMYDDLRKNFAAFSGSTPNIAQKPAAKSYLKPAPIKPQVQAAAAYSKTSRAQNFNQLQGQEELIAQMIQQKIGKKGTSLGSKVAVFSLVLAAALKFAISALEFSGAVDIESAFASQIRGAVSYPSQNYSSEQVALLKTLDTRRVELEDRRKNLEKRESEANNRDREFAIKLAELRDLTQVLKTNREGDNKKKTAQLDQLSNVYGSMDPKEAALLIEQLDDAIAIELLNRMPEKRIGQILALMNKDKALMMTRMLSGRELSK
jgi:flagellar motility protein MotE (MotC chaperone)